VSHAGGLSDDLETRLTAVDSELAIANGSADPRTRVEALLRAGVHLLGEDFRMVPEFALEKDPADEWDNAWNAATQLLKHQTDDLKVEFPVDDWLYGTARVREKMHHWENLTFLTEALGNAAPDLHPMQLPYRPDDSWLALSYPETYAIDGDRLLYTAHYATDFDKTKLQCGLLLDEWTEVIPTRDETTGVSFHYDRPSTEPPQVMLLVTPPAMVGQWHWEDLVDALRETLDMAKRRAVEPEQIDTTSYARFLPAALMAATLQPITIEANLAMNNEFHVLLGSEEDE